MIEKRNTQTGLIKFLILIVIAIIILGYFGFDLRGIVESEPVQNNLSYAWEVTQNVWHTLVDLWNKVLGNPRCLALEC